MNWAGHVDDDAMVGGVWRFCEGGKGAEEEAVDVGEDGGATRGDAALLEEEREVPEKGVDVRGGFLGVEGLAEEGGEVSGVVAMAFGLGVADAEGGMVWREVEAAAAVKF